MKVALRGEGETLKGVQRRETENDCEQRTVRLGERDGIDAVLEHRIERGGDLRRSGRVLGGGKTV